ncbi:ABC transporter substrate-binding protein [Herbiconiux sp. KACC 21604]|uniref:ABC transporter substrate-binding protein n=1 Tax=unclassified Herbiconiux TaxID=2618217 RepID=UPI001492C6EB|nr:ABC transporter substrate-binding protein [Herbiconiux sp. SALV-R1]QJU52600.1 ABC transporter substrate-binding protein [Herbiconiux sp. SALV-R1]WPO87489.1 ABC transporter substrate-binding protein [Herbiconiux sp. KACC 21604]
MFTKKTPLIALGAVTLLALAGCSTGSLSSDGSDAGSGSSTDSATASEVTVGTVGVQGDIQDISNFCGDKDLTVALADGFGGNSWRKITRAIFEEEAAKCPNIKKVLYTDAQGDTQKAISDMNSLVAQGVDVIVTFVDGGEALLPTIQKATDAGVKVVPFVGSPGGTPGTDYVDFVSEDINTYGKNLAAWTIEKMGGKGNLVMLGGIAGNSYSQAVYDGVLEAVKENPDITLLNEDGPVSTDWEPGKTQQVVAGLITKYGDIDGIVADYGGGSVGGIRAFEAAGKPLPVWSANDSNEFACLWYQYKDSQPTYQIATESSRNWVVTAALHKGLAAANGLPNDEPSTYNLEIIEDSTDPAKQPKCEADLPPDAILSSGLSVDSLKKLFQ